MDLLCYVPTQEEIEELEKEVASLKSSVQEKTTNLAASEKKVKKLEDQLRQVCTFV